MKSWSTLSEYDLFSRYIRSDLDNFIFVWFTDSFCVCLSPFSNGSVNVAVLIKMDMKTTINQQQLLQSIKGPMAEGVLGKFQVDYSSIAIQGSDSRQMINSWNVFFFSYFFLTSDNQNYIVKLLQILMPLRTLSFVVLWPIHFPRGLLSRCTRKPTNCHMHSETCEICRKDIVLSNSEQSGQIFEWQR